MVCPKGLPEELLPHFTSPWWRHHRQKASGWTWEDEWGWLSTHGVPGTWMVNGISSRRARWKHPEHPGKKSGKTTPLPPLCQAFLPEVLGQIGLSLHTSVFFWILVDESVCAWGRENYMRNLFSPFSRLAVLARRGIMLSSTQLLSTSFHAWKCKPSLWEIATAFVS